MRHFTPLVVLALAPWANAGSNEALAKDHAQNCCPCTAPSSPEQNPTTITTTVTATQPVEPPQTKTTTVYITRGHGNSPEVPTETVTVERHVTLPGKVVYITKTKNFEVPSGTLVPSHANYHEPGPKTVTLTSGHPEPKPIGKVNKEHNNGHEEVPKPSYPVPIGNPGKEKSGQSVTLGYGYPPMQTDEVVTIATNGEDVVTKIIHPNGKGIQRHTVIVEPSVSAKTVTLDNGKVTTEMVEVPHELTMTAPAHRETAAITTEKERYQTITNTVGAPDGGSSVEIIVIDHETGISTCRMRHNGQPCNRGESYSYPESPGKESMETESLCGSMEMYTSTMTVYNTVVKTLGHNLSHNQTATWAAEPARSTNKKDKRTRKSFSGRW